LENLIAGEDLNEKIDKEIVMKGETRNIIDHMAYWKHEAIMCDLDSKRNNFTVVCCNIGNDFNISTVVRNSNAFLAKEVWIYGKKQYDRRGAVGTQVYTRFKHVKEIDELATSVENMKNNGYRIVGIDNVERAVDITNYSWSDQHVVMIFGQEQIGIPENVLDLCDDIVYIPQYGSVRSLNVGTASGIAMYDYCAKVLNNVNI